MTALPALFAGLFYDRAALDQAREISKGWDAEAREALRAAVPAEALAANIQGRSVRDVARDVLAIASAGLKRRARLDAQGRDETMYLAPLERIVDDGRTLAERRLELYRGPWKGSVNGAFSDCVLPI
jgi:glutamate--cysteine ligase